MKFAEAIGLKQVQPVGGGACGEVYRARDGEGREIAVKVFRAGAVNPALLEESLRRLREGTWPAGALQVQQQETGGEVQFRIMPWLADEGDGGPVPRSLQHRLADFPGPDSWRAVREILVALASFHERQVPHGNLKPGNVFFDGNGKVVLSDWALGRMPGVPKLEFTDAILYQSPEQLLDPGGYYRERGYRWDVFSFAVLAYRLVTGSFPRCADAFDGVAPAAGETSREGIAVNFKGVARMIGAVPEISWPDVPANGLEGELRRLLERCLSLDPSDRPANAGEVLRQFVHHERAAADETARRKLASESQQVRRGARRANLTGGLMALAAVTFGILWHLRGSSEKDKAPYHPEDLAKLEGDWLQAQKQEADRREAEAAQRRVEAAVELERERRDLAGEREFWRSRLVSSREVGDSLFAWVIEDGNRKVPALDSRSERLARLEREIELFLNQAGDRDDVREELALARLQLAEVSLARGAVDVAAGRLDEAIASAGDLPASSDTALRLATDRVWLALLLQDASAAGTPEAFVAAREAVEALPGDSPDADRVARLIATLDFREARLLAAAGSDDEALDRLHQATRTLARLSSLRPDVVVLRSELARCFLESADLLDGLGQMGSAREVRGQVAEELLELLKREPGNAELRLELAGCYGSMAEAAVLAGDGATAHAMSAAAIKLLEELVSRLPDRVEVRSMLAGQQGLMAGILRDRGETEEARVRVDAGIVLVEAIAADEGADPMAKYRLALLLWQKARLIGVEGEREEEINLERRASETLRRLLAEGGDARVPVEQVRRSLGYVLGDMGHAAQISGEEELARVAFTEAISVWSKLTEDRPGHEEYREGLDWSRRRLGEL